MKGISKTAIATATAKGLIKQKKRKSNMHSIPNYRVDVHISSSNSQNKYNK